MGEIPSEPIKRRINMGLHPISETANMTDPVKGFMFELVFENLLGDKGITGEEFELRAQSYTFPGENLTDTSMNIAGHERVDAGLKKRGGSWSTQVIETQKADVSQRFESWLNIMHDLSSGVTGLSSEYKVDITVNMLNAKKQVIKPKKLKRAWPHDYGALNFAPTDATALKMSVNWRFDWWE